MFSLGLLRGSKLWDKMSNLKETLCFGWKSRQCWLRSHATVEHGAEIQALGQTRHSYRLSTEVKHVKFPIYHVKQSTDLKYLKGEPK